MPEVKAYLATVSEAPDPAAGKKAADAFVSRYERLYPSAVRSFLDDLSASLAHLELPAAHGRFVRTTSLIERSFGEERRRTTAIPRFFDEYSALKLVFGTLTRATARWHRLRISEIEDRQILRLRE